MKFAGSRFLSVLVLCLLMAWIAPSFAAAQTTYNVGPGQPYASIGDVPWESLAPGDTVLIHWRETPYAEKFVIGRQGTAQAWITISGVPGPLGQLPVIDGRDATTRPQLNYWNENRGLIKIGGSNTPPDTTPQYIVIENLELRSARPPYSFTGRNGLTDYVNNAAGIYVEKGAHLVFRNCITHDNGNGIFTGPLSSDVLVEGCYIHSNGMENRIFEHNTYTESLGIVYQYNRFGPLRASAGGNNLKDRSAGTVIRYNFIEGGNRQLDLVETDSDDFLSDPSYRNTFVYGNILIEPDGDGNSQILHYGGDNGDTSRYRKGTLHFYHNTVVSRRAGNTTLMRLSSDGESAHAFNNILFVTASGNRLAMLDDTGSLLLENNWLKTGWVGSHSNPSAAVTATANLLGSDPVFADLPANDFSLTSGSPALNTAMPLPSAVSSHPVSLQYAPHQSSAPRPASGPAADLGAYEFISTATMGSIDLYQ